MIFNFDRRWFVTLGEAEQFDPFNFTITADNRTVADSLQSKANRRHTSGLQASNHVKSEIPVFCQLWILIL